MIQTPTAEQYKEKHFDEKTGEWLPSGSKEAHGVLVKYWAEKEAKKKIDPKREALKRKQEWLKQ